MALAEVSTDRPDATPDKIVAAPGPVVLSIEGARCGYRGRPALHGVDLDVRSGEVFTLLGPNGAGKTTLVRAICGRIRVLAGRVSIGGFEPRSDRRARAATGLVPQDIALYARLTGRENLSVFARLMGVPRAQVSAAVEAAMDLTHVASRADEVVGHLSGGWRRRFNIAAGVLHRPQLLILDEPTVGVDLDARAAIHEAIDRLRQNGMAVLLITHDFEQAETLADRIGVMLAGRLVLDGRPADLLRARFGGRRQARLTFTGSIDPSDRALLVREGLRPLEDSAVWVADRVRDYAGAAAVANRLESQGLIVTGVTLREPSLADLFGDAVASGRRPDRLP